MKICAIMTCYLPNESYGGPIHSRTQGFMELIRRGHEVTVLTSNILDQKRKVTTQIWNEKIHQVNVIRFRSLLLARHFSAIFSYDMLRWLQKHADLFDVFHITYARELIPILTASVLFKKDCRVVLQTHGTLDRDDGVRRIIDRLVTGSHLVKADRVIVLQEKEEATIGSRNPQINTTIVPNGFDRAQIMPDWSGPNPRQPVVLFLARLHPRKNVLAFIRAASLLHESDKEIKFKIAGPDGGDELTARQLVRDLGLDGAISFMGSLPRDRALAELASASVYVLPSHNEPFATTVTEALAIGTPIIVTDSHQNLDLLEKYNAVETSKPTPEDLAEHIRLLLGDTERCISRSKNGKLLVQKELDIKRTVDKLEMVYHSIGTL